MKTKIIIEGKGGCGKTTLAGIIHSRLRELGFHVTLDDDGLKPSEVQEQMERTLKAGCMWDLALSDL